MVLAQKWLFLQLFVLGKIGRKNVFYDTEQKIVFLGEKKKKIKIRKSDVFPKGLAHGIGPKLAIFPTFFLWRYGPGKCLLRYSRKKKCLSRL